jgi:ABC-2 type transport system permease protein
LAEQFLVSAAFDSAGRPETSAEAAAWLQSGRARVALVIPETFQRSLARGDRAGIQLLLDGTNSNVAAQARSNALGIVVQFNAPPTANAHAAAGAVPIVRVWYNSNQSYTPFVVLSMIALAALMVGMIHPAASIVREKESGTIEQLRVTPIGRAELFVAKTLPTMLIGLISVYPSLLIVWWFGVPLRGSLAVFMALTALFLVSAVALGVLIAAFSTTLQQALLLSFFVLFPTMFLSGTIAPVESMPEVLQALSLASPLRHYMDVILGVFLKGAGIDVLWPQALALLFIGSLLFTVAALVFRRGAT